MPFLLILGGWLIFSKKPSQGNFGAGRGSRFTPVKSERITFADVAGITEAKEELQEIVEFLKNPAKHSRLGGRIPKGVLLQGAPGTGKATAATEYLRTAAQREATPNDWVYVHNFRDPYQPSALRLAPGMGRKFAGDVRRLIEQIQADSERDRWFTAEQAKEYGLVDAVIARRAVARSKAKDLAGSQPGSSGWRHDRPEWQGGILTGRRQGDPFDP